METRGDIPIRGIWDRQTNATIDVKLGDADADIYRFEPMEKLLDWWEKPRRIRMVSTYTSNRNILSACSIY